MPTKQMKFHVKLPNFTMQNEQVKSLVNFFMEHASMVFHGDYDQNNKLTSYTGCVRFNNRVHNTDRGSCNYDILIPYHSFYDNDFPNFPILPTSSVSDTEDYPFIDESYLDDDSVIDTELPYLLQVKTAMGLYNDATEDMLYKLSFQKDSPLVLPAIITPKIGDVINENPKFKPKGLASGEVPTPSIQGVPIETIFDENGNQLEEFIYDFQLRTELFNLSPAISGIDIVPISQQFPNSVYYKIGFCSLKDFGEGSSVEEFSKFFVQALKNAKFVIYHAGSQGTYSQNGDTNYSLNSTDNISFDPSNIHIEWPLATGNTSALTNAAIVKVKGNDTFLGVLYFKLYNGETNEPILNPITNFELLDGGTSTFELSLNITDQDLDLPVVETPDNLLYLTSLGRRETQNTTLPGNTDNIPLYSSTGERATFSDGAYTFHITEAFDKDGNTISSSNLDLDVGDFVDGSESMRYLKLENSGSQQQCYKIEFYARDHSLD